MPDYTRHDFALWDAMSYGLDGEAIQALSAGANPNVCNPSGHSPLDYACHYSSMGFIEHLLALGATPGKEGEAFARLLSRTPLPEMDLVRRVYLLSRDEGQDANKLFDRLMESPAGPEVVREAIGKRVSDPDYLWTRDREAVRMLFESAPAQAQRKPRRI